MQPPRLAPGYCVLEMSDGVVLRRVDGRTVRIRTQDRPEVLLRFLQSLDGTRSPQALAQEFGLTDGDLDRILGDLRTHKVLCSQVREPEARWRFFSHLDIDEKAHDILAQAHITVVGVHALGSELVRVLHDEGLDVRWLEPTQETETADLMVVAHENPDPGLDDRVNQLAIASSTRWTRLEIVGASVLLGPTVLPGVTACWSCLTERAKGHVADPDIQSRFEEHLRTNTARPFGNVPSLLSLAAALAGIEIMRLLIEPCVGPLFLPQTYGTQIVMAPFEGTWHHHRILRLPRCKTCGVGDAPRHAPWTAETENAVRI